MKTYDMLVDNGVSKVKHPAWNKMLNILGHLFSSNCEHDGNQRNYSPSTHDACFFKETECTVREACTSRASKQNGAHSGLTHSGISREPLISAVMLYPNWQLGRDNSDGC
jgi:hypothetical protein